MADIDAFLKLMKNVEGSHLYLSFGHPPAIRINGLVENVKYKHVDQELFTRLLFEIMSPRQIEELKTVGDVFFNYEVADLGRYRCEIYANSSNTTAILGYLHNPWIAIAFKDRIKKNSGVAIFRVLINKFQLKS